MVTFEGFGGTYICESSPCILSRIGVDKHVRSGSNNGGIDEAQKEEATDKGTNGVVLSVWVLPLGQTANLLANPADAIRRLFQTGDDGVQKAVADIHEHLHAGFDDLLDSPVLGGLLGSDALWEIGRQAALGHFNVRDHLLINLERVDFQVQILQVHERVDALR
jgi:hypothetical protein